uniref:Uncharacterized protein n=1 Tax=Talaromyces marneffei PM1 TaxID=1077442 RepID=A0A093UME6_TALMA
MVVFLVGVLFLSIFVLLLLLAAISGIL